MTETPLSESLHIALAGLINSGKSSLMNNLFESAVAIVSDKPGTTTDPVTKKIELAGAGSCAVTDTAGIDDEGELGAQRVLAALSKAATCDVLVIVSRADRDVHGLETKLAENATAGGKKVIVALTFSDREHNHSKHEWARQFDCVNVDNGNKTGIDDLRKTIIKAVNSAATEITPLEGIVRENDSLLLAVPIDLAAPKGRLILPQVETIRDALDRDCVITIAKEREIAQAYANMKERPALVITDSQAFSKVAADIGDDQKLTSFSILFARKKGDLALFTRGTRQLDRIKPGSKILIIESCSHHRQADDIGTVKIPRLLRQMVQSDIEIEFTKGVDENADYSSFSLAIFCGGCMRTRREMLRMTEILSSRGIAVTNYGLFLAFANGLLPRALEVFPYEYSLYTEFDS